MKRSDPRYNPERYSRQRLQIISEMGGRCWTCMEWKPDLEVVGRPGMKIKVPEGGRWLRSLKSLREKVIPYARVLCEACKKGERS